MNIEKIKQLKNNTLIKKILLILIILITFLYLKSFFTTGIYFNGAFLKKEVESNETHYVGKAKQGDIHITVIGKTYDTKESKAEVIYNLPNNINKRYTVYFNYIDKWVLGTVEIKDEKGSTIFEGRYQKGSLVLYDKNNEPMMDEYIRTLYNEEEAIYNEDYKISLKNIVEFSLHEKNEIRGNTGMLFFAALLLIINIIDIKYPLFFFTLSYGFAVEEPKPSELYLIIQKIGWIVYPIITLVLLIIAIWYFNFWDTPFNIWYVLKIIRGG